MDEPWVLYDRHALHWERVRRGPVTIEADWIEAFTELVPDMGAVLDLGCGHGDPIARHLLANGFAVTGVDRAPALVHAAQRAHPAGTWLCADMARLRLETRFDGLVLWHSLFHLSPDDQRRTFEVLDRHAGARAVLLFTTGPMAGTTYGELNGEPLYHASLDPEEYARELADANFELLAHAPNDANCGGATVWFARRSG